MHRPTHWSQAAELGGSGVAGGSITVGGRVISVTSLDRVVYPDDAVLKQDVISYYVHVAPRLLPHIRRRPVTRIRWPNGVLGESFYERNTPSHAPEWIPRAKLHHSDGDIAYPLIEEPAALAWLAQQNALELHVPQWRLHGEDRRTDRLVFDLDPGPGMGLAQCAELALWLRQRLGDEGLVSVPVTSGSKGIHLYARWRQAKRSTDTREFARGVAQAAEQAMPDLVTSTMTKQLRKGKVLIDWSQNNPAKTTVSPYSLRGRVRPWVAAPRSWDEIEQSALTQLTMSAVLERLDDADPLSALDD
jgi:bifunctional non-homologous end joining protein LigD